MQILIYDALLGTVNKLNGQVTENVFHRSAQCLLALRQVEERHYGEVLVEEGYPLILKYGICFCKKSCMVKIGNMIQTTQ